jgi:amino acid transporter/mannitol/fructose-specific phosphotransferase system IIA component (Ntr-type)
MELKKGITFFGVFSIATGAMISSGIFILPGLAFAKAGPAVSVSYFIAGILGLIGILSVVELATAMPKAGGDYYFINKAFGPMFGTISGFLGWFALSLKSAFAIFGISEIVYIYTGLSPLITGFLLCILFVTINLRGVKEAAVFQIIMVMGLLLLILIYIIIGIPKIDKANFTPFMTAGINEIIITSGFIFISFGGLLKVANVSEEVINPKRNIPLGIFSSVIVVTIFYTLITIVITGTLDSTVFKESLTPVADSARIIMGPAGYLIIIIASTLAFFTTANAGIMSASRYPMALSRDQLLPHKLGAVNEKYKTPTLATIITGVIIYLSLLLPLEMLVKAASTVILTSYVLTNIAVIILRESKITNYQPSFKAPLYPFLQIACVLLFSFFIVDLGKDAIEISLAFIFISFCIYMFYGKKIKKRESALLHLLKRITDSKLSDNILEDELREVLINRDNIEQDSFDSLIKTAKIIDIDSAEDFEKLLNKVVHNIVDEVGMKDEEIISRFLKRQKESNTAVSDFLAIPHIVIEGEDKMFLLIVRCREGVKFTEDDDAVKAIFLLGGTKEKRTLHLKSIASIATLVGLKSFQTSWLSAESIIELKNLMILSRRKRFY